MSNSECIVHYPNQKSYSTLKKVSQINKERLCAAKEKRIKLGGNLHHESQCESIPDDIIVDSHHIHLDPCYKRFTSVLGNKKYKENITKVTTRLQIKDTTTIGRKTSTTFQSSLSSPLSSPLSVPLSVSPLSPVQLFSDECQLCHKHRIQYGNEKIEPTLIVTFDAERKIKENAKIKNETLYNKIKDLDLIATEFKYHRVPCYRDFTRSTNNSKDKVQQYQKGDFATVEKFITNNVIKGHQVISLKALHEMYNLGVNDKRYRYKLKERLERHFGNDIFFLTLPPPTEDCIIIGRKALKEEPLTHCFTQDSAFKYAAETMKNDILTHYHNLGDIEWPPTIEELSTDERKAPRSVYTFLEYLLKLDNKEKDIKLDTLVDSFAQDFLHGVTRGRMITAKHFLMGLGLHNMTGQKNVVDIVNKLGHSISYNRTCEIETAQAEAANRCRQSGDILQLRPETPNDIVLTYFWADNLDKKIDSVDGGGMIHMTTLVAFQEKSINVIKTVKKKVLNIQKSRRLSFIDDMSVPVNIAIDTKKDPPKFDSLLESSYDVKQFSKQYFIWLLSRKQNEFDQVIPNYYGWTLKNRTQNKEKVEKTLEVYLPPINAKVTQFETIKKYLDYLTLLSNSANMPYVNIFLDVGAAMNAYKFIWNNPRAYSTIVLHLGSFHFMKENFLVIGDIVKGSGFEDVVYEAGLITSGSLQGVLAGTHYNRAWNIHSTVAEALERLLISRFIWDRNITFSDDINDYFADGCYDSFDDAIVDMLGPLAYQYESYKEKARSGELGKTPQYWLIYLDLMYLQTMVHSAVQENDIDKLGFAWYSFLPYYFVLDKQNYARYGSYYVTMLRNMDATYPGLKSLIDKKGISVQGQDRYPLRTSVDQRGEQTINKDAKTAGGIVNFASKEESVLKWCLNRSEQSKNTYLLKDMAGIKSNDSAYTALRPSRILRSEKLVTSVVEVLKEDYIHPFSPTLDTQCLYNISSGVPIEDNEVLKSLNMKQVGMKLRDSFIQDCLVSGLTSFHAPIKRNNIKLFASTGRTVKLTIGKETSILKVNRNIMARLISWSVKSGKAVDFKEALRYPLCPIPLSIAFPDGSKRSTAKSKLLHELGISYAIVSDLPQQVDAYVIDVMAQIRSLHGKPDTFEDLAMKLINCVPKGVNEVHFVADSYLDNSIKSSERKSRGDNRAVIIKSIKSKIPSDFQSILKNNDSKTRIIDLLLDYIIKHRAKVLNNLRCMQIYFSKYNCCQSISLSSVKDVAYLSCKQEEADTRIFRHCQYILNVNKNAQVVIRSPSGDTDIVIIATYLLNSDCIFLDNGTGKNRNYLQINKLRISEEEKKAIIGFHAVTGNDYVSSFFGKGKRKCWKKMVSKSMFLDIVKCLGDSWDIPETFFTAIEEFICAIYNAKSKTVNAAREEIFTKKYANENKIIDLSFLPPCDTTLQLHVKRANFVAKLWKTCLDQDFTLPDIQNHGWLENGDIQWVKEVFPDDYRECLSMESEEVAYGSDTETDSETEDNI